MPDTLALWHAEHENFTKLLDLLENQLALFHEGDSPDYELMLDIMYYMTHYPDVMHHPKEDLVFALMMERDASVASRVGALSNQHASLKSSGEQLVRDLGDIVNGSILPRERVEASARVYLASFRNHMRVEDNEILPLARRLLGDKDWTAIDAEIDHLEDPLFGSRTEERYAALAEQIARESKSARAITR